MPFYKDAVPCVGWWTSNPTNGPLGSSNIWVGHSFKFHVDGRIFGVRHFMYANSTADHHSILWHPVGQYEIQVAGFEAYAQGSSSGWVNRWYRKSFRIVTGDTYNLMVSYPLGGYFRDATNDTGVTHNDIEHLNGLSSTSFNPPSGTISTSVNTYGVDVLFRPD